MRYTLHTNNGSISWEWEIPNKSHYYSPAMCTPYIYNNCVHIVAPDMLLRTFDLQSGAMINEEEGHQLRESIGGNERRTLVAKTMKDSVIIWDVSERITVHKKSLNAGFGKDYSPSDMVFDDDLTFFGTTFGEVIAADRFTYKVKCRSKVSKTMLNTPRVLKNHRLLVTTEDGGIFHFKNINNSPCYY